MRIVGRDEDRGASYLRRKARSVLESIDDLENCTFEELKSKFELRFG